MIDIEDERNHDIILKQLSNLEYKRIIRTINFIDDERYDYITEIVIYNHNNEKCFYIPGELYKKEVLVDFEVIKPQNLVVQIPSDIGDKLNLKYLLRHLCTCVKNSNQYDNDLKRELSKRLEDTKLFNNLYQAFWKKSGTSIEKIIQQHFNDYLKFLEDNIDIEKKFFFNFLVNMDKFFVQFLYIKEGINPFGYLTVKIKTTKDISNKEKTRKLRLFRPIILQNNIDILVNKPYPLAGKNTLIFKIIIPRIEKFYYENFWYKKIKILTKKFINKSKNDKITISQKSFSIYHSDAQNLLCSKLMNYANFTQNNNNFEIDFRDNRSNFANNEIMIYFRQDRNSQDNKFGIYCEEDHKIKYRRTLKNNNIPVYYFLGIFSLILFHIFFNFNFNHYIEIFIAILIAITFDYINKSKLEKNYIKWYFNIFLIILILIFSIFQYLHLLKLNP